MIRSVHPPCTATDVAGVATRVCPESSAVIQAARQPFLRRLADLVFGYDYFISYAHADAANYAARLASGLRQRGRQCFLDRDHYRIGDDWKGVGYWSLRRTTCLVVLLSRGAHDSEPVAHEIRVFRKHRNEVVPIEFPDTFEHEPAKAIWRPLLPDTIIRHRERLSLSEGPSAETIERLIQDFKGLTQDRRRLRILSAALVLLAALAIGAAGAAWLAERNAEQARTSEIRALSRQKAAEAQAALSERRLQAGVELALQAQQLESTQESVAVLFQAWQAAGRMPHIVQGFAPIEAIAYTAEGASILVWQRGGRLTEWNLDAGGIMRDQVLDGLGNVTASAFSADGTRLAVGRADGSVIVLGTRHPEVIASLRAEASAVRVVAFGPGGTRLAVGYAASPGWRLWDLERSRPSQRQPNLVGTVELSGVDLLAFSQDGRWIASATGLERTAVALWRAEGGKAAARLGGSGPRFVQRALEFVELTADGSHPSTPVLAVGWDNGDSSLYASEARASEVLNQNRHEHEVTDIAALDGALLTTGRDGLVHVSPDAGTSGLLPGWSRSENRAIAVHRIRHRFAVGGADGTLVEYDLLGDAANSPSALRLSSVHGQRTLVEREEDRGKATMAVLDARTGATLVPNRSGTALSSDRNATWRAFRSDQRTLEWLDLEGTPPKWKTLSLPTGMFPVYVKRAGATLFVAGQGPSPYAIGRLDRVGEPARSVEVTEGAGDVAVLSPGGDAIALLQGRKLLLIDATTARVAGSPIALPALPDDEDDRYELAWSADGRWLLAGVKGSRLLLLRREPNGFVARSFHDGHGGAVFSPDARFLLSRRPSGLWELRNLRTGAVLFSQPLSALPPLMSPGGKWLLVQRADGRRVEVRPLGAPTETALEFEGEDFRGAGLSRDDRWSFVFTSKSTILLDNHRRNRARVLDGLVPPLALSPDGSKAALVAVDGHNVGIVDLAFGTVTRLTLARPHEIDDVDFTTDGRWLAVLEHEGTLSFWDPSTGRRLGLPFNGEGEVKDSSRQEIPRSGASEHAPKRPIPEFRWPMTPDAWVADLCARIWNVNPDSAPPASPATNQACRTAHAARALVPAARPEPR